MVIFDFKSLLNILNENSISLEELSEVSGLPIGFLNMMAWAGVVRVDASVVTILNDSLKKLCDRKRSNPSEENLKEESPSGIEWLKINKDLSEQLQSVRAENLRLRKENEELKNKILLANNNVDCLVSENEQLQNLNENLSKSLSEVNSAYSELKNSYETAKKSVNYLVHLMNLS